uniref:Uncharacterized protein n=1 Tax=Salvator merianae TaxID=96440 RepID=A0A8D0B1T3_SALMN
MWVNSCIFFFLCWLVSAFYTEERFASKNNVWLKDSLAKEINHSERRRGKRMLSGRVTVICCPGRDDECTFIYNARNAICYCDAFCAPVSSGSVNYCLSCWTACGRHLIIDSKLWGLELEGET